MAKFWKFKKLEKLKKIKAHSLMINADSVENLATGRTDFTNRKKECPKYLK